MTNYVCNADIEIAARTVYGEARGETAVGALSAVAHTFVNRWKSNRGQFKQDNTLAKACLRHAQFSAWNEGDPNLTVIMTVGVNTKEYRSAMNAVVNAISYPENDPTNGALWYHTKNVKPNWSEGKNPCAVIGNHIFFNDIDW